MALRLALPRRAPAHGPEAITQATFASRSANKFPVETRLAASRQRRWLQQGQTAQTPSLHTNIYSPEAAGGAGCKLESREIVATIIPERNCIVATSLLSNA